MSNAMMDNRRGSKEKTEDQLALEEFDLDNTDLERLEERISAFNLFEAVGMVGQEIRHSQFLAFLLDPSQNHGLRDTFLKRFLALVPMSLIDLDTWDLSDAEVAREQDRIDIRVSIASRKLVVIIENKLYTGEHSGQLARYLQTTQARYPGWAILPIYLTLDGSDASDPGYLPVGYAQVADLIQEIAEKYELTMARDSNALLRHYVQMLRRHHLPDQELDELCARIYQRHRRALDLIFERRPDRQLEIARLVYQLFRATPDVECLNLNEGKRYIVFNPTEWSSLPNFYSPGAWSERDPGLLFVFENRQDSLRLKLQIDPIREDIRQRLWQFVAISGAPFKRRSSLAASFPTVYKRAFLDTSILDKDIDTIEETLTAQWSSFVAGDLSHIRTLVCGEFKQ